jgi:hypothetical protein
MIIIMGQKYDLKAYTPIPKKRYIEPKGIKTSEKLNYLPPE